MNKVIRIGSRGSDLALKQVSMVREALAEACPEVRTELVVIRTAGDWRPEQGETRLSAQAGGKGQFTREIQQALLAGDIDCAVHSMKDVETFTPPGLAICAMLQREDVRDAMLFHDRSWAGKAVGDLPAGFRIGTASVRRQAFLLSLNPGLDIQVFRGNVPTRIAKLRDGQVDATLLAVAGLRRLGLFHETDTVLPVDTMLPSAGQGAVGIECRADDEDVLSIFGQINHWNTYICVKAERAALAALDGSCHSPIGAYACLEAGQMYVRVCVVSDDGIKKFEQEERGKVETVVDAEVLGRLLGDRLKTQVPQGILGVGTKRAAEGRE